MAILADLASQGRTILVASHDLAGVMAHFPRVLCMNGGIVADGPPAILRDDAILRRTYGGHRPSAPYLMADEHHA
jgi:ABC-type Mn2+/Zn2+ transport system ATPase subunit